VPFRTRFLLLAAASLLVAGPRAHAATYTNFESQQVHSLALTPDGTKLLAVNTPDSRNGLMQKPVTPSNHMAPALSTPRMAPEKP